MPGASARRAHGSGRSSVAKSSRMGCVRFISAPGPRPAPAFTVKSQPWCVPALILRRRSVSMRDVYHEELDSIGSTLVEMTGLVGTAMARATVALQEADLAVDDPVI